MSKDDKERQFWQVDPTVFRSTRKASFFERYLLSKLRVAGKYLLYALAFFYPVSLAFVGVAYGGIAFWSFFAGSVTLIGILIWRLGYSRNFASWNVSNRKFIGSFLAFLMALGFYAGLIYLKIWMVPIAITAICIGLVLVFRKLKV